MARVLVVDDEQEIRQFVSRVLEGAGHAVEKAPDGAAALAAVEARGFDLVLTDVYMAQMDGMELLLRIQQRGVQTPVVVISGGGYATKQQVLKMAASCGAAATLEKPFTPRQLMQIVDRLLKPSQSAG